MGQPTAGRKTKERREAAKKKHGDKPEIAGAITPVPQLPPEPAPPEGVDMADILANPVGTITIWDPRRDVMGERRRDTGIRVEVSAIFSEEGRKAIEETRSRLTFVGGEVKPEDPNLTDTVLEQVVAVTRRWWHVDKPKDGLRVNTQLQASLGLSAEDELLACTPENVRTIFTTEGWGWFYAQIRDGWLEVSNFFGSPQKTA